jgi:hypothetical protein
MTDGDVAIAAILDRLRLKSTLSPCESSLLVHLASHAPLEHTVPLLTQSAVALADIFSARREIEAMRRQAGMVMWDCLPELVTALLEFGDVRPHSITIATETDEYIVFYTPSKIGVACRRRPQPDEPGLLSHARGIP